VGTEAAEVLKGLTTEQQATVMRLRPGQRLMGGYGADSGVPGLIERVGINHPIFGSHYQLTPAGIAVWQSLHPLPQGHKP
jgi:hypothetical protein